MLTVIGKNLVYATVIFSLCGLGLSLWSAADQTNFTEEIKTINAQIARNRAALENEKTELTAVLNRAEAANRKIPRGPDEIAGNRDLTVTQALQEAAKNDADYKSVFDQMQSDVTARIALISEMQLLRSKLQAEKETGNALRLIITPDAALAQQGFRSFRDQIASFQVAEDEVERRTEAMQPDLYNAAIRLQALQQRLDSLRQRAQELEQPRQ